MALTMPKYSTWHWFSCSNTSSCDCQSLHASRLCHLEMAAASNNAFCPEEIISNRLHCKLRCCTLSPKVEMGTACESCLSYDPAKGIYRCCRLQLYTWIPSCVFPFCTKRNPLSWVPLLDLDVLNDLLSPFCLQTFLQPCSISSTHQDRNQPPKVIEP